MDGLVQERRNSIAKTLDQQFLPFSVPIEIVKATSMEKRKYKSIW